ncbi:hypothetical protein ACVS1I_002168 [Providencia rettgeri]
MMTYDRYNPEWQQNILLAFYHCKNGRVSREQWNELCEPYETYKDFYDNIIYLSDSGLLNTSACPRSNADDEFEANTPLLLDPSFIRITNLGVDFLRADGGLSAILNVNVIKLHDDTLSALSSYVDKMNVSDGEKNAIKNELKKLPVDGLRHVMTKAIDTALNNPSEILRVVQVAIQSI